MTRTAGGSSAAACWAGVGAIIRIVVPPFRRFTQRLAAFAMVAVESRGLLYRIRTFFGQEFTSQKRRYDALVKTARERIRPASAVTRATSAPSGSKAATGP